MAEQLRFDIFATDQASPAFTDVASSAELAAAGAARLKEELDNLAATTAASTGATLALANADRLLGAVEDELSGKTAADAAAQRADAAAKKDNAAATARLTAAAGAGAVVWGLTAAQLHWIVAGTTELLAVTLPATIALAGFGAAGAKTAQDIAGQMKNLNTATGATNAMLGQTTSGVLGLGGSFAALQDKVQPQVLQLFGAALNASSTGVSKFGGTVTGVGSMLDVFAAKVDVALKGTFGTTTMPGLMAQALPDLRAIGQVFGNLGQAVIGFASKMPGVAEMVLRVLNAISGFIFVLSKMPAPIIEAVIAFSAFNRYGTLAITTVIGLFTALSKLALTAGGIGVADSAVAGLAGNAGRLSKVGAAATDVGKGLSAIPGRLLAVAASPWTWAAVAVVALSQFSSATQTATIAADNLIADLSKKADASPNITVLNTLTGNYWQLVASLHAANAAEAAFAKSAAGQQVGSSGGFTDSPKNDPLQAQFNLRASLQKTVTEQSNVRYGAMAMAAAYGVTVPQALLIADQAGVKLKDGLLGQSKAAKDMRQQVDNYVSSLRAMGIQNGILGSDQTALSIATGIAATKVSDLNAAWDQTVALSTGVQSGFIKVQSGLDAINSATSTASVTVGQLHDTLGKMQQTAAAALAGPGSMTATGLAVRSAFQAAITSANAFFDQLRTGAAAGAISQGDFTKSVASTIAQMLPYAAQSKVVTSQLAELAFQAGGPLTSNYKILKDWVDKNALSTSKFNTLIGDETIALSNVTAIQLQFAAVMQTHMATAIADGLVDWTNITKAVRDYQDLLADPKHTAAQASAAQTNLSNKIITAGRSAHWTQDQIATFIAEAEHIPKKEAMQIVVAAEADWSVTQAPWSATSIQNKLATLTAKLGFAGGGPIRGQGGPTADNHLIRASTGEYVVQAKAVEHYGQHMMDAINTQKFAYGGPVAGLAPWWKGEAATLGATMYKTNNTAMLNAAAAAIAGADNAAVAASNASLGGSFSGPAQQAARQMLAAMGWSSQWPAFNALVMAESGWNVRATNPSSGAYGIPQALPPGKMASAGADWMTNAITQLRWMMGYIRGRWGDPNGAWANEQAAHWYGSGGVINEPVRGIGLRSGLGYMFGEHGTPETVTPGIASAPQGVTRDQIERLITAVRAVAPGVGDALNGVARTAAHAGRYATR